MTSTTMTKPTGVLNEKVDGLIIDDEVGQFDTQRTRVRRVDELFSSILRTDTEARLSRLDDRRILMTVGRLRPAAAAHDS